MNSLCILIDKYLLLPQIHYKYMEAIKVKNLGIIDYCSASALQENEKQSVIEKRSSGTVFFLQHYPSITLGRHCAPDDILYPKEFLAGHGYSVFKSSRGGRATVHEPGQLVIYYVLPVKSKDSAAFAASIVEPMTAALNSHFGLNLSFIAHNPGIWQDGMKCASIGFDLRGGVSMHGVALNVCNNLTGFSFINPCGMPSSVMTTMSALAGRHISVEEAIEPLALLYSKRNF